MVDNGAEGDDEDPDQYDEDVEEEPETTLIKRISYYVRLRPGLAKFLRNAASMYEVRQIKPRLRSYIVLLSCFLFSAAAGIDYSS